MALNNPKPSPVKLACQSSNGYLSPKNDCEIEAMQSIGSTTLMIGATGMLRDAAIWVAARSDRLILVSRQNLSAPLFDLHNVQSVIADWREPKAFIQALKSVDGFSGTKLAERHSDHSP